MKTFRMGRRKILVLGPYHAGKSTFIRSVDPDARAIEASDREGGSTTVAMDFGRITVDGMRIYLFGTPGQDRFAFVRDLLSRGIDGAILVVDATAGIVQSHQNLSSRLLESGIPFVYLLTKCDREDACPEEWKRTIQDAPVYAVSGLDPDSCRHALVSMVKERFHARAIPRIPTNRSVSN